MIGATKCPLIIAADIMSVIAAIKQNNGRGLPRDDRARDFFPRKGLINAILVRGI